MSHPVPLAIDRLVVLLHSAALPVGPLAGVRVDDGPPPAEFDERDAIGVGVMLDEFDALSSAPAYSVGSEQEPTDVQCVAQSWTGDADKAVWSRLRARVFELLDGVRGVLAEHRDLDLPGAVWSAEIARWSLRHAVTAGGAPMVVLNFTVRIQAYRTQ